MHPSDRQRIALFTYSTQPRGGVLHALALAEALHDCGHDVRLYALADNERGFIRRPRCPFELIPSTVPRGTMVSYVTASIAAYVDGWDRATPPFDIYHAHDGISANALATLVERGVIPRFVRTVHHLDDFASRELAALQDRGVMRAQRCLVVSRTWRDRLLRQYGRAATVVPNGVDTSRFVPSSPTERERLQTDLGYGPGPLFVTIGGVEARKNTLAALDAFALVRRTEPAARFVIAGGASVLDHAAYRRTFDARLAQLGAVVGDALVTTGVLSDAEIVALLRAADALVFPSLIEGFGLAILEALACATPVITSARAPFSEFLNDDDALLVDPLDPAAIAAAMCRVRDPDIVAMGGRGPAVAAGFSWSTSARSHLRAYRAHGDAISEVAYA